MKKRIFAMLLAVMLMVSLLPVSAMAAEERPTSGFANYQETVVWEFDDKTDTMYFSGTGNFGQWSGWTSWWNEIRHIVIGEGIEWIDDYAFEDLVTLESVVLPNTLESIGQYAFGGCTSLKEIELPNSLTRLWTGAFHQTGLKTITIPKNVEKIHAWAFVRCFDLTGFYVDPDNAYYSSDENGVLYNKDKTKLVQVPPNFEGDFIVADTVQEVGGDYGEDAFESCNGIENIYVPASVTSLNFTGDYWGDNLEGIWVDPDNASYCSDEKGVLYNKEKTQILLMPAKISGDYTIPDTVQSVDLTTFNDKGGLENLYIPASVAELVLYYSSYIEGWTGLKGGWVDPDNPNYCSDDKGVLYSKDKTELIYVPAKLTGDYRIPASVKTIGTHALSFCEQIDNLYMDCGMRVEYHEIAANRVWISENDTDIINDEHGAIYSADGTILHRAQHRLPNDYEIPENVGVIDYYAFSGAAFEDYDTSRLVIPETVDKIGVYAFKDMSVKEVVIMPSSDVDDKGASTFMGSFIGCTGLERIALNRIALATDEYSRTEIGWDTFSGCESLNHVVIPEGVEVIADNVFSGCKNLTDVYLPESLVYIGSAAFNGTNLQNIYFAGNEEQWNKVEISTVDGWGKSGNAEVLKATVHYECEFTQCTPGHYEEVTAEAKEATCTENGHTQGRQCILCGEETAAQEVVEALGHTYANGVCAVCGAEDPDYVVENPFTDVADDAWYAAPVLWAYGSNVTGGTSATTFGPDDSCTRAQVVTFLWASNGKPEPESMDNPFSDVADNAWYLKPVLWAVEQGITGGVAEGRFGPDQTCTRAQIATFLYAAAGKPDVNGTSTFGDVADDAWFAKPVIWAAENEVTGGIGDGKFGPNNTCTRAQVVTFLYKVYADK